MAGVLKSPVLWLACLVTLEYLLLPGLVPPRVEVEKDWESGPNWFGQPLWTAYYYAGGLLLSLCALRYLIVRGSRSTGEASASYGLALAALLPGVWLFVVVDWDNEAVAAIACWVGVPVAILFVPSAVFGADLLLRPGLKPVGYALRSILEIGLLVPVWCQICTIAFFILGWVGP